MCRYQGYEFGAGRYPDSVCIDGRLHDADNCDGDGNVYLNDEDIPCPMCRPDDAIEYWTDQNAMFWDDAEDENDEAGHLKRARRGNQPRHRHPAQSRRRNQSGAGGEMNAIQMTAKLYEAREAAKRFLGDRYPAAMREYGEAIKVVATASNIDLIPAATKMSQRALDDGHPYASLFTMAACVELIEPSEFGDG